jgi:nucleoside-diphosphate-sugar epimerase
MKVLVTGASGFVGTALMRQLAKDTKFEIVAAVRQPGSNCLNSIKFAKIDDISAATDWGSALCGVKVVIHTAARVHVMRDTAVDSLAEFRRVNVEGTLNLARQAATAGIHRFVFISSIKVNGEGMSAGGPYTADDKPAPADPYGISKAEAEDGLRALATETGMDVVIIRPVLVYGPGVKGNFLSMMQWLDRSIPLPLGAICNKRSLVALDNLVDLIVTCMWHPAAANQTFLVSDDEDVSTTELLRRMGEALGKPAHLLPLPAWVLTTGAFLFGKRVLSQRLCGSLQVDISKTKILLGWSPPMSVNDGLRGAAQYFLTSKNCRDKLWFSTSKKLLRRQR